MDWDVPVFPLPGGAGLKRATQIRAFRRALGDIHPDAVLVLYGGFQAVLARLGGVAPYIVYIVGGDIGAISPLHVLAARVSLRGASLILANGEDLARETTDVVGRPVVCWRHGIDLAKFPFVRSAPSKPSVLVTRGFHRMYNQKTIAHAVAQLPAAPGITLTFASGDGDWRGYRDEIFGRNPHARDWVHFVGGVSHHEMPSLMRRHTHYLSMSLHDGTPSSLLEAMATGLHPILSDIPANREWFPDGRHATVIDPLDARTLAGILMRLPETMPSESDLRENRAFVENRGSAAVNIGRLFAALARVTDSA